MRLVVCGWLCPLYVDSVRQENFRLFVDWGGVLMRGVCVWDSYPMVFMGVLCVLCVLRIPWEDFLVFLSG